MQKIIGNFPDYLWQKTKTRFFDVDGDLKFYESADSKMRRVVEKQDILEVKQFKKIGFNKP